MRKTCKQGFTLIEILFVIAILSVLASLGVSVLQQRAQQLKVERTALQMQQILQAGMAYKSDSVKQEWPTCDPQQTPDFDKYRPTGLMGNPWGYSYECHKNGDKETFIVKVQVPNDKIVDQIKALLPNAGAIAPPTTPPTVFTEVSGTGGGSTTEKVIFKDVGMINIESSQFGAEGTPNVAKYTYTNPATGNAIPITCPSNMKGHLLFLATDLETGDFASYAGARVIKKLIYNEWCGEPINNITKCTPVVTFQANTDVGGSPPVKMLSPATKTMGNWDESGRLYLKYVSYCQ